MTRKLRKQLGGILYAIDGEIFNNYKHRNIIN